MTPTPVIPAGAAEWGPLSELSCGIDALYLSVRGQPEPDVVDALEWTRDLAGKVNQPVPLVVDVGLTVMVAPHGLGKYRYNLSHPSARMGSSSSSHARRSGSST